MKNEELGIAFDNEGRNSQISAISNQQSAISNQQSAISNQQSAISNMATIFTKIINGEIPSLKIAEDAYHYSFLDINPIAEGHTLVVPKKETDYFFDLSQQEIDRMMAFAKKIAAGLDEALEPLRTGIIVQGLEVPHAHIHLVPLYTQTQPMALGHNVSVSEERMEAIAKKISKTVTI